MGHDGGDLGEASRRMFERAERLRNLEPAFRVFGAWLEKRVDDGFQSSREFDGTAFPPLAESTIDSRIRRVGGFKTQKRSGLLTAGAARKQSKMRAPGGIKILVDTARARNSQHTATWSNGMRWSAVGYLGPHMTGGKDLPRRNPTPFEKVGGKWRLASSAAQRLMQTLTAYVAIGKAAA